MSATVALTLALVLVALVCAGAWLLGRRPGAWQTRTVDHAQRR
jgi:hypothetical protein